MATPLVNNLDFAKTQLLNARLQNLGADPGGLGAGDKGLIWIDAAGAIKYWDGAAQQTLGTAGALDAEQVQDIVGAMHVDSATVDFTYNDAAGTLVAAVLDSPTLGGQNGAFYLARANHTGTQLAATISDFQTAARAAISVTDTATLDLTYAAGAISGAVLDSPTVGGATAAQLRDRSTHTGTQLAATISDFNTAVRLNRLDQLAAPTAAVAMNGQKITGLADGTAATDAATWGQVQAALEAKVWKDPVDAATTAALPAVTYNAGAGTLTATANAALAAQDGVALAVGDSLLVKNQASSFQNGIYTVTQLGSGAAPFILTRRADASTNVELQDATVMVEGGTTQGGDIYTQTTAIADLTAAAQTWSKTGDTNTVYAADGSTLALTGNTFSVANGGITATQLAASVAGAGLVGGAGTPLAVGAGTGISVAADAVAVDTAVVARKVTATLGDGAAVAYVVPHNLGNQWVNVNICRNSAPFETVIADVERTDANNITVRFAVAPTAAQFRAVITG